MTSRNNFGLVVSFFVMLGLSRYLAAQNAPVYQVLYIDSYHQGFVWSDSIADGLTRTLKKNNPLIELHYEHLDTKRLPISTIYEPLVELFERKYSPGMFDVIVVSDDNAFDFVIRNRSLFLSSVPLIFCGVNNSENSAILHPDNLTGVLEDIDFHGLLELILSIHSDVTDIACIGDATETGYLHLERARRDIAEYHPELTYIPYHYWTMEELAASLSDLPDTTVVVELAFHRDRNGRVLSLEEEEEFIQKSVKFPVYTLWDYKLGYGILGGVMTSGSVYGEVAANMVLQVLDGVPPEEIPIKSHIPYPVMFDYRQMQKFGISLSAVPRNAIVINKPVTLWNQYKIYFIAVMIFIFLQGFIIIILIINIRKRIAAEKLLKEINSSLEKRVDERTRELSKSLDNLMITQKQLIESEKMAALGNLVSGIAHEVNTPLGVSVTAASHLKSVISRLIPSDRERSVNQIDEVLELMLKNLSSAANLVNRFRQIAVTESPENERPVRLQECLETVVLGMKPTLEAAGISISVECPENVSIISLPGVLTKVTANLIQNSILHGFPEGEHSGNSKIWISVNSEAGKTMIHYRDNGSGIEENIQHRIFEPFFTTKFGTGGSGLGLHIVYNEVVHHLHGKIELINENSTGVHFLITLLDRESLTATMPGIPAG